MRQISLRIIWTILFGILLVFFGLALFKIVIQTISHIKLYQYAGIGVALYVVMFFVLGKKIISGFDTFVHELAHAIVATMLFRKVQSFWVTAREGGEIRYSGNSSFIITLAPYSFPFFTLFFIFIKYFIDSNYIWIFDILIGLTFAFHYHSYYLQTRVHQTDLKKYGYVFSYIYIFAVNFFVIAVVLLSFRMNLLHSFKYWFSVIYEYILSLVKYLELVK